MSHDKCLPVVLGTKGICTCMGHACGFKFFIYCCYGLNNWFLGWFNRRTIQDDIWGSDWVLGPRPSPGWWCPEAFQGDLQTARRSLDWHWTRGKFGGVMYKENQHFVIVQCTSRIRMLMFSASGPIQNAPSSYLLWELEMSVCTVITLVPPTLCQNPDYTTEGIYHAVFIKHPRGGIRKWDTYLPVLNKRIAFMFWCSCWMSNILLHCGMGYMKGHLVVCSLDVKFLKLFIAFDKQVSSTTCFC